MVRTVLQCPTRSVQLAPLAQYVPPSAAAHSVTEGIASMGSVGSAVLSLPASKSADCITNASAVSRDLWQGLGGAAGLGLHVKETAVSHLSNHPRPPTKPHPPTRPFGAQNPRLIMCGSGGELGTGATAHSETHTGCRSSQLPIF
jgi:hypothetical protein